jgi:hypothetical protein
VAIFCFYKFFPVIGGGALVINTPGLDPGQGFSRPAPLDFVAKTVLKAMLENIGGARVLKAIKSSLARGPRYSKDELPAPSVGLPDMPGHLYFSPKFRDARISIISRYMLRSFNVARCIEIRHRNYVHFLRLLNDSEQITPLFPDLPEGVCPLSFPVIVRDRDRVCAELNQAGIPASPWWVGYHAGLSWDEFENARFLKESILSLPLHQFLDDRHIAHISNVLKSVVSGEEIYGS